MPVPIGVLKDLGQQRGLPLTPREREVVATLLAGHVTRGGIAETLGLAERTVNTHLEHIYAKAGAINMVDLVLMALGRKASAVDFSEIVW